MIKHTFEVVGSPYFRRVTVYTPNMASAIKEARTVILERAVKREVRLPADWQLKNIPARRTY